MHWRQVIVKPKAVLDLAQIGGYYRAIRPTLEMRFLSALNSAFARILTMPSIGTIVESGKITEAPVRYWRMKEFPKYLLFYQVHEDSIVIVRVLHGSRDWQDILEDE